MMASETELPAKCTHCGRELYGRYSLFEGKPFCNSICYTAWKIEQERKANEQD